jgi:prolyl-tRNA synthetase
MAAADVIAAAELTDAGPVRGTVILRPRGYAIWDALRRELDARIAASGAVAASGVVRFSP